MFASCVCVCLVLRLVRSLEDQPRILGRQEGPRLLSRGASFAEFNLFALTVLDYDEDSAQVYAGGTDFLVQLDLEKFLSVVEKYNLSSSDDQRHKENATGNTITVIEKLQDSLFVCGTDGVDPRCWTIFPSANNRSYRVEETREAAGISPLTHTQNSLSLTVEGDVYAAAPLDLDGSLLQFRRRAGRRADLWMDEDWLSDPTFISASLVQWKEDPDDDKIYMFFREKNADTNPEAEPWISRVARVCKVDEGGPKQFFQNTWTSFLKARLVCGYPKESLYFNHLQDVHVMNADDWRLTRIYALFSSGWNSSAVCIYTIKTIERIFEKSSFKGFNQEIPKQRPGMCVKNSRGLSTATLNVLKDYPEMSDWVNPVHSSAPLYVSKYRYNKIAVDTVQAADMRSYNVLLLATDSGRIHKVLETGSEPFIVSQTKLSNSSVRSMKLDSRRKKLLVGFSDKIVVMNLQNCQDCNASCEDCVLARDPYCSWTSSGCIPTVVHGVNGTFSNGVVQDIIGGRPSGCTGNRTKRNSAVSSKEEHFLVPPGVPFYLTCPIHSYHATYTWEHEGRRSPCVPVESECLLLIPAVAHEHYGTHRCVSEEHNHTQVVKTCRLESTGVVQKRKNDRNNIFLQFNCAKTVTPDLTVCLVLALVCWFKSF